MVNKYYNHFMELAQYCMMENVVALTLILKFISKLWQSTADKIAKHRFNSLMDCYGSTQLTEANIKGRNVEHAQARNPKSRRKMIKHWLDSWQAPSQ